MVTYLHRLNSYPRYQQRALHTKEAKFLGLPVTPFWNREETVQSVGQNAQPWSNEQVYQALYQTLPPDVQREQQKINPSHDPMRLMLAAASDSTGRYDNMFGYIVQSQQLENDGKPTGFFNSSFWQSLPQEYVQPIRDKIQQNLDDKGATGVYGWTGFQADRSTAGKGVREAINDQLSSFGTPGGQSPGQQVTSQAQPQEQQQNPSMWNYMLPALAAGAPLALLGGLGGGSKWGLGLLGAAGLAGLGYGMARHNGWEGWDPINNFANTINGWFGMGNTANQNTQNQYTNRPPTAQELNTPGAYYGGPGDIIDNSKVPENVSYEAMDNPEDFGLDPNQSWQMSIGPGDRYITNGNGTTYFTSAQNVQNQGQIRQNSMKTPTNITTTTTSQAAKPNTGAGAMGGKPGPKTAGFLPKPALIGTGYANTRTNAISRYLYR